MTFDEVELGDDLPEEHPDVSLERVRQFVGATDMPFGRFTDDDVARSEGLPWAIVPGVMSQGLLAAMIHRWAPGSRVLSLDTVFRSPSGSAPPLAAWARSPTPTRSVARWRSTSRSWPRPARRR